MKKIKRAKTSLLCYVLLIIASLCLFAGCELFQASAPRTIENWTDGTENVAYGNEYRLTTVVTDSLGDLVDLTATVETKNGEKVSCDGNKFLATEKNGYKIEYSVTLDGKTYRRTVTLNVVSAEPIVSVGLGFESVYTGTPFKLPQFTAYDHWDGDVSDSLNVRLFAADADVDLNYDGSGSYTFNEAGKYYALATAENESGVQAELRKDFTVIDSASLSPDVIKISKDNYTDFSTTGGRKFVSANEWSKRGLVGEYTGNAIHFPTYGNGYANIPFVIGNRDLSMYTHLSVWITVDPFTSENVLTDSAYINLISSKKTTLLSYVTDSTIFSNANAGVWRQYLIKIEDFTEYAAGRTQLEFISASASNINASNRPNIYVGDVSFIKWQATQIPSLSSGAVAWYDNSNNSQKASTVVNAQELSFAGDYTGEQAISFMPYSRREARLVTDWQYYDLTQFTHLSLWVACDTYIAQTGYLQYGNGTTVIGGQNFSAETSGRWIQYLIPIAQVQASYQAYGHVKLLCITMSGQFTMPEGNSADRPNIYIGDVQLVSISE